MNAPGWLPDILAVVMLAVAAFSLWRLAVARAWGRATDYGADAMHALMAVAVAGMLVTWLETLPRAVWTALFAAAALWFAGRLAWSARRGQRALLGRHAAYAGAGAAMVYMFAAGVAPSTLDGSTAGQYTMAGMPGMIKDTTLGYPSLGLLLVVAMAVYAVVVLNQVGLAPGGPGGAAPGPRGLPVLAPRAVDCCRVVLAVTMAYAILTKIV